MLQEPWLRAASARRECRLDRRAPAGTPHGPWPARGRPEWPPGGRQGPAGPPRANSRSAGYPSSRVKRPRWRKRKARGAGGVLRTTRRHHWCDPLEGSKMPPTSRAQKRDETRTYALGSYRGARACGYSARRARGTIQYYRYTLTGHSHKRGASSATSLHGAREQRAQRAAARALKQDRAPRTRCVGRDCSRARRGARVPVGSR